ncbi:MAG TPA: hypothetical protein VHG09_09040, partial [Longimicrobiales bacterium]|nr:hypothetical protein [Longimicrobiales bacterium]
AEVDFLAAGATLDITLNSDGTTTGTFFVPDGDEEGGDVLDDLTGTWTLDDNEVEFDHTADTFITDVTWTYANGRLSAEHADVRAVLTRQ